MDAATIAIVAVVVLSLVALLAMARRRRWNADGSDDAKRNPAAASDQAAR